LCFGIIITATLVNCFKEFFSDVISAELHLSITKHYVVFYRALVFTKQVLLLQENYFLVNVKLEY